MSKPYWLTDTGDAAALKKIYKINTIKFLSPEYIEEYKDMPQARRGVTKSVTAVTKPAKRVQNSHSNQDIIGSR